MTHPHVIEGPQEPSRPLRGVARGVSDLDAFHASLWIAIPGSRIKHLGN